MHLAAFYESIAPGTLLQTDAVQDDILTTQGGKFLLLDSWDLIAAQSFGTDLQRGRLVAPTFNKIGQPYVRPVRDLNEISSFQPLANYTKYPFALPNRENIGFEALHDDAADTVCGGLILLSKGMIPTPPGQIYTIRGTASTAAVPGVWTSIDTVYENDLEGGFYNVVGGAVIGTGSLAFRVISQYQVERPGGLCLSDINQQTHPIFRAGALGKWIEFESDSLPTVQVLSISPTVNWEVYLDIVKVR